jgi:hypothetical protein
MDSTSKIHLKFKIWILHQFKLFDEYVYFYNQLPEGETLWSWIIKKSISNWSLLVRKLAVWVWRVSFLVALVFRMCFREWLQTVLSRICGDNLQAKRILIMWNCLFVGGWRGTMPALRYVGTFTLRVCEYMLLVDAIFLNKSKSKIFVQEIWTVILRILKAWHLCDQKCHFIFTNSLWHL